MGSLIRGDPNISDVSQHRSVTAVCRSRFLIHRNMRACSVTTLPPPSLRIDRDQPDSDTIAEKWITFYQPLLFDCATGRMHLRLPCDLACPLPTSPCTPPSYSDHHSQMNCNVRKVPDAWLSRSRQACKTSYRAVGKPEAILRIPWSKSGKKICRIRAYGVWWHACATCRGDTGKGSSWAHS